jgi:signal peptidase I
VLLAVAIAVAFAMKAAIAQAFYIPSPSMVPQLEVHDRIVVSKLAYHLHDPRRGDIVVFDCPPEVPTCKRPRHRFLPIRLIRDVGEAVGAVQPDRDEFIKRVIGLPGETVEGHDGHVFVNGRRLIEPYLPQGVVTDDFPAHAVPPHQLWVMGDNRGDSEDSRSFGPILRRKVVGRTVFRIWPLPRVSFL